MSQYSCYRFIRISIFRSTDPCLPYILVWCKSEARLSYISSKDLKNKSFFIWILWFTKPLHKFLWPAEAFIRQSSASELPACIHESLCMYHPSMCTECKLQLVNIHVKYCNIEGDEPSNWCHFTTDAIERINAYRFLKMMKKYFERSLNGSAWRNSAASLLLHLYNFIESIENAGNSVSVTAVRPGGWSWSLDTSHSSPVTQKCRQMSQIVTKCYTSTPVMWPLKCQKRNIKFACWERNMMLSGFGKWLDWWLNVSWWLLCSPSHSFDCLDIFLTN